MTIGEVSARIASLKGDVITLTSEKDRLSDAESTAYTLLDSIRSYKSDVEGNKDSVNALFGSFSWEGQTVQNFETLYGNAVDDLQGNVIRKYGDIIGDLASEITVKQNEIDDKNSQISYWEAELQRLYDEQDD